MNTATHVLTAAAILTRRGRPYRNAAVLFGGLIPDLSIFVLFGWARAQGFSHQEIWHKLYWQEPWQTLGAIANSFPIWLAVLLVGFATGGRWLGLLAAAVLVHLALDFPVHADDAHRHFWPLTDWRYHSPFSYWDPAHHGGIIKLVEVAICIAACVVLWRRFANWVVRGALALCLTSLALVPLFFWATLG